MKIQIGSVMLYTVDGEKHFRLRTKWISESIVIERQELENLNRIVREMDKTREVASDIKKHNEPDFCAYRIENAHKNKTIVECCICFPHDGCGVSTEKKDGEKSDPIAEKGIWEYRMLALTGQVSDVEKKLNVLGLEGWKLLVQHGIEYTWFSLLSD